MAKLAVQLTIGDYATWRPIFEKYKHLRTGGGVTNERVYRDADSDKEVLIWADVADVAKARQALGSAEVRAGMQEAGVVGPPRVQFIE